MLYKMFDSRLARPIIHDSILHNRRWTLLRVLALLVVLRGHSLRRHPRLTVSLTRHWPIHLSLGHLRGRLSRMRDLLMGWLRRRLLLLLLLGLLCHCIGTAACWCPAGWP